MDIDSLRYDGVSRFLLLVLVFVVAVLILTLYSTSDHAYRRHGPIVDEINSQCDLNPLGSLTNASTGRSADICQLPSGIFGIRIWNEKKDTVITSFPRKSAQTIEDVLDYLINSGYK